MGWFKRSKGEDAPSDQPFAVLQGERDGRPLFAIVNRLVPVGAEREAAPWRLVVTAVLDEPTDAGLTTDGEAARLNALEDQIEAAMAAAEACYYLGRSTWNGRREIVYYVADLDAARAAIEGIDTPAHRFDVAGESDAGWALASDWLAA